VGAKWILLESGDLKPLAPPLLTTVEHRGRGGVLGQQTHNRHLENPGHWSKLPSRVSGSIQTAYAFWMYQVPRKHNWWLQMSFNWRYQ